jgi:hypothetical protein
VIQECRNKKVLAKNNRKGRKEDILKLKDLKYYITPGRDLKIHPVHYIREKCKLGNVADFARFPRIIIFRHTGRAVRQVHQINPSKYPVRNIKI